jgi:hypothetical protein
MGRPVSENQGTYGFLGFLARSQDFQEAMNVETLYGCLICGNCGFQEHVKMSPCLYSGFSGEGMKNSEEFINSHISFPGMGLAIRTPLEQGPSGHLWLVPRKLEGITEAARL